MIDESGHALKALVGGNDHEIGAADDRGAALGGELPREADAIMMRVEIARPAKPMAWEAFVNPSDHASIPAVPSPCNTGSI